MEFDEGFIHYDDNIIVMFDEEGNEQELSIVDSLEWDGNKYLLVSNDYDSDSDEMDVVVLKQTEENDETVNYSVVEDDDELDELIKMFEKQNEDFEIKP